MPGFWVSGGDHEELATAFQNDESVTDITPIDETDGARLYRAE